jgi:hypothetical protein
MKWCLKAYQSTLSCCATGQFPGERLKYRILGASRTYTTSHSWIEVSYGQLTANAGKVLWHLAPGAIPLAIVKGNAYGHGAKPDRNPAAIFFLQMERPSPGGVAH